MPHSHLYIISGCVGITPSRPKITYLLYTWSALCALCETLRQAATRLRSNNRYCSVGRE